MFGFLVQFELYLSVTRFLKKKTENKTFQKNLPKKVHAIKYSQGLNISEPASPINWIHIKSMI